MKSTKKQQKTTKFLATNTNYGYKIALLKHNDNQTYEPGHEKMCLMSYANNKGADQPAHPRSLISAFVVRCLESISLDSIAEIPRP